MLLHTLTKKEDFTEKEDENYGYYINYTPNASMLKYIDETTTTGRKIDKLVNSLVGSKYRATFGFNTHTQTVTCILYKSFKSYNNATKLVSNHTNGLTALRCGVAIIALHGMFPNELKDLLPPEVVEQGRL